MGGSANEDIIKTIVKETYFDIPKCLLYSGDLKINEDLFKSAIDDNVKTLKMLKEKVAVAEREKRKIHIIIPVVILPYVFLRHLLLYQKIAQLQSLKNIECHILFVNLESFGKGKKEYEVKPDDVITYIKYHKSAMELVGVDTYSNNITFDTNEEVLSEYIRDFRKIHGIFSIKLKEMVDYSGQVKGEKSDIEKIFSFGDLMTNISIFFVYNKRKGDMILVGMDKLKLFSFLLMELKKNQNDFFHDTPEGPLFLYLPLRNMFAKMVGEDEPSEYYFENKNGNLKTLKELLKKNGSLSECKVLVQSWQNLMPKNIKTAIKQLNTYGVFSQISPEENDDIITPLAQFIYEIYEELIKKRQNSLKYEENKEIKSYFELYRIFEALTNKEPRKILLTLYNLTEGLDGKSVTVNDIINNLPGKKKTAQAVNSQLADLIDTGLVLKYDKKGPEKERFSYGVSCKTLILFKGKFDNIRMQTMCDEIERESKKRTVS